MFKRKKVVVAEKEKETKTTKGINSFLLYKSSTIETGNQFKNH
jgi:hypothetical protein